MNINAFGTDIFLRFTIRSRLARIKEDDKVSNKDLAHLTVVSFLTVTSSIGHRL